jgi:hypothetical protein
MADDNTTNDAQAYEQVCEPDPALKSLDRLVGAWEVSGRDIHGKVTFEWMEGGFFLVQHVDLDHGGIKHKGIEYIGYDKESKALRSHYFDTTGSILEYTYELRDDTLTIWFGDVGSPARFTGKFSDDGNTNIGRWEWPGGGYEATMTKAK